MLNIEVKNKQIGNNTFYVRAMPPLMALNLLGDLQAVITSSVSDAVENNSGKELLDREINLGSIIAGIGNNLKGASLVAFAERIINDEYVSIQLQNSGEPVRFNKNLQEEVFTGRIKDMLSLMYFVLEVNYKDFFDSVPDLSGIVARLTQK